MGLVAVVEPALGGEAIAQYTVQVGAVPFIKIGG